MSFASDLLDGFDLLYKRTDGVLKSTQDFSHLMKKLSSLEKDYAKALTKLVKDERKDMIEKASSQTKEVGTTLQSWETIFRELERIAEHHSQYADKLENEISKNLANYVREKQKIKKKLESDGSKLTKDWKATLDNLQKTRGRYVSLSKEAEVAEQTHQKGKGDMAMKPSQLAKLASKSQQCAEKAAAADTEYQNVLSQTNQKQSEFYTSLQPSLLNEFQAFEEDRLKTMKEMEEKFASYVSEFPGVYSSVSDSITSSTQAINVTADIQTYVNENKTGVSQPPDIQYIAWDSDQPSQPKGSKPKKKIGKYAAPDDHDVLSSKEWGLRSADHSLSVEEQQNKLRTQLEDLDKAINSETKSKEGLENLVRFYGNDPVAQKKAEEQVQESEQRLQKLLDTKNYVQGLLDELGAGGSAFRGSHDSNGSPGTGSVVQARGLYDYTATCDTELSFREGDILTISEQDDSGWWYATYNGKSGFIPNNYVTII